MAISDVIKIDDNTVQFTETRNIIRVETKERLLAKRNMFQERINNIDEAIIELDKL